MRPPFSKNYLTVKFGAVELLDKTRLCSVPNSQRVKDAIESAQELLCKRIPAREADDMHERLLRLFDHGLIALLKPHRSPFGRGRSRTKESRHGYRPQ